MNKDIKEILNYMKQYVENIYEHDSEPMLNYKDLQIVLSYIEQLEKKAELGEHYKHLYSEVKKQKDDVVEYIKYKMSIKENYMIYGDIGTEILRMLGEIDE